MDSTPLRENNHSQNNVSTKAKRIVVQGLVQGVGFRPFIYQLALQHQLSGWVRNCLGQVEIHVEGNSVNLADFEIAIFSHAPAAARPVPSNSTDTSIENINTFSILDSVDQGKANISVPADLFTCDDCLAELNQPANRRYRYPFINCTQCGPRYTLIRSLPYDRPNTTMVNFRLCPACLAEYENPLDRRYHAEPVACPDCGPTLEYKTRGGESITHNDAAIAACIESLRHGDVIAVKGIGGYHLMCDASNDSAVTKLRNNKPRPDKPLAVIFPAPVDNPFAILDKHLDLTEYDKIFITSPSRPILLVNKPGNSVLSEHIAPGLSELGVMLPYSPLHHLLLNDYHAPLVATSANLRGEPVLIGNAEVEQRLGHVAEGFLHHNRPIERPADDPVFRTIRSKARPIRLGRGFSPAEFTLPFKLDRTVLAVGAHMKNTITLAWDNRAVISPHIGEMDNARSLEIFQKTIDDLQQLYRVNIDTIVRDAHPGYTTTRWANQQGLPVYKAQHHRAHASSIYYEADTDNDMLVFTWDGVGYGDDNTLWGGEALLGHPGQWTRFASMRPFYLPGGERAGRDPWRSAAALCWENKITCPVLPDGSQLLYEAWNKKINSPLTTSAGRLFDAAAALTGLCTQASFEGQGPMQLEAQYDGKADTIELPLSINNDILIADWQALLPMLCDTSLSVSYRSSCFHLSLANTILNKSIRAREQYGITEVGFSGGVFQNRVLTELAADLLELNDFTVHLAEKIPLNDAGISFGQIIEYAANTMQPDTRNMS